MTVELTDILNARDIRYAHRMHIADKSLVSVSLSLNIPGLPKSSKHINSFFSSVLDELKLFFKSHKQKLLLSESITCCDADGDFFIAPILLDSINVTELKSLCESFEQKHTLGRLIDVDVVNCNGEGVSSGKLKKCFLCNTKPAIECMREKNHSYDQLRSVIDSEIGIYLKGKLKKRLKNKLSSFAIKALLHEVSLSPKPGLVDRFNSGSHNDMDFSTFVNSTAVISVYFADIVEYACIFTDEDILLALPQLRILGLEMESDMFSETHGVNTHKGAIFLLVFAIFVSAYLIYRGKYTHAEFVAIIKQLNAGIVQRELVNMSIVEPKTHGELCYERFGSKGEGIRGEIENGLPMVFNYSLGVLHKELDGVDGISDEDLGKVLTKALLIIMSENNDTNILFRKGQEVLDDFKKLSADALNYINDIEKYNKLLIFCEEKSISPGGAADLLALSLYMYYVDDLFL